MSSAGTKSQEMEMKVSILDSTESVLVSVSSSAGVRMTLHEGADCSRHIIGYRTLYA